MTLSFLSLGWELQQKLVGRKVAQRLVGAHRVIDAFPGAQLTIERFQFRRAGGDLIELLAVGAVGALHRAVEFRRAGREDEQAQAALLAWPRERYKDLN